VLLDNADGEIDCVTELAVEGKLVGELRTTASATDVVALQALDL